MPGATCAGEQQKFSAGQKVLSGSAARARRSCVWHMTCDSQLTHVMAQKLPLLKLLQEIRGYAEVGNRSMEIRPLLAAAADLRPAQSSASLPHRRFSIPVRYEHHPQECAIPVRHTVMTQGAGARILKVSAA